MQSPGTGRYTNRAFCHILQKLTKVIESLVSIKNQNEGRIVIKIENRLIHELLEIISTVLNNGIDNSAYDTLPQDFLMTKELTPNTQIPTPQSDRIVNPNDSFRCYFTLFNLIMPQRRSIRFINTLSFLKNDKLRGQIWILCELSDARIIDIFEQFQSQSDLQARYYFNSLLKNHHDGVRELLQTIYDGLFELEGEVIQRYQRFCSEEESSAGREQFTNRNSVHFERDQKAPKRTTIIKMESAPSPEAETKLQSMSTINNSDQSNLEPVSNFQTNLLVTRAKNSLLLYNKVYQEFTEDSSFQKFQRKPRLNKLSEQRNKCYFCLTEIHQGFGPFIKPTSELCEFSGKWFCTDCMNSESIAIPYKAVQDLDLKPYRVSKLSYSQIKSIYNKPIFIMHYFDDLVFKNDRLHEFLLLKRELHLMYDSICNVEFLEVEMSTRKHLFLTINLICMSDLELIKDGSLSFIVSKAISKATKHMHKCEICQQKAFWCPGCVSKRKIFAFDIQGTQYCRECKSLYHRKCFPLKDDCLICKQNPST